MPNSRACVLKSASAGPRGGHRRAGQGDGSAVAAWLFLVAGGDATSKLSPTVIAELIVEAGLLWHEQRQARLTARPRRRAVGAGAKQKFVFVDRLLATSVSLRHGTTHDVLAYWFGVDRSTITRAIGEVRPLLAQRGCTVTPDVWLRTLAEVVEYLGVDGVEHWGNPPVGVVHPCGGPAQFVAELEQGSPVLWVEPDPQGSPPGRESAVFVWSSAVLGHSECGVAVGALLWLGRIGVEWPVHVEEQQWLIHDLPRSCSVSAAPWKRSRSDRLGVWLV